MAPRVALALLLTILTSSVSLRLPFAPAAPPVTPPASSSRLSPPSPLPVALLSLSLLVTAPPSSFAISSGGLDYANLDLTASTDFSGKSFVKKDFSQVIAKGTSFVGSTLTGARFYKAYLVNSDFTGADLTGVSLEDTSMDGASLRQTVAKGAYFSASLKDVGTVEGADFTDASIPDKTRVAMCMREDLGVKNGKTGVTTAESLECP